MGEGSREEAEVSGKSPIDTSGSAPGVEGISLGPGKLGVAGATEERMFFGGRVWDL